MAAFCSFVVGLILCAQASMGNMEAGNTYANVCGGRRRHRRHLSPLGGTGLLLGTLGGAAVWQTLENGLNMIGAQVGIQRIVIGVIVVFAVLLDVVFRRGIFSRKTTKKTNELPAGVQENRNRRYHCYEKESLPLLLSLCLVLGAASAMAAGREDRPDHHGLHRPALITLNEGARRPPRNSA